MPAFRRAILLLPKPAGDRELSDPFTAHPGDELTWAIPPQ